MGLLSQFQLEYTLVEGDVPVVTAIIVAAGNGTRMGCDKQLLSLLGIPVLARTLSTFQQCNMVRDIVLVTKEEQIPDMQILVDTYQITKVKAIVAGGNERQQSVANGLDAVSCDTVYVAIHDGARPLIQPEDIIKVITAAGETGAAALGVPVKDTIKVVDDTGKILDTPQRSALMAVQTPQVFNFSIYDSALKRAKELHLAVTDDCQIVEDAGYPVYIVEGSYKNIKITTPDDVALAELLLQQEESQ